MGFQLFVKCVYWAHSPFSQRLDTKLLKFSPYRKWYIAWNLEEVGGGINTMKDILKMIHEDPLL